jgi:hypothetical protein
MVGDGIAAFIQLKQPGQRIVPQAHVSRVLRNIQQPFKFRQHGYRRMALLIGNGLITRYAMQYALFADTANGIYPYLAVYVISRGL